MWRTSQTLKLSRFILVLLRKFRVRKLVMKLLRRVPLASFGCRLFMLRRVRFSRVILILRARFLVNLLRLIFRRVSRLIILLITRVIKLIVAFRRRSLLTFGLDSLVLRIIVFPFRFTSSGRRSRRSKFILIFCRPLILVVVLVPPIRRVSSVLTLPVLIGWQIRLKSAVVPVLIPWRRVMLTLLPRPD